jgi:hypothetical protein
LATADRFSHMGIIKHNGGDIVVVEASDHVKETPLQVWINRGVFKRVAIYRDIDLTQDQVGKALAFARHRTTTAATLGPAFVQAARELGFNRARGGQHPRCCLDAQEGEITLHRFHSDSLIRRTRCVFPT